MSKKRELREHKIINLLSKREKIDVATLSKELGVSQVTIRKDLDYLEEKGFVKRIHGYAILNIGDEINSRLAYHYNEKRIIALRASELVSDGETIMIENGSCACILADVLAQTKKNLTIITNSAFIANYIRDYNHIQTILLGGIYQHDSQCLVGPMIKDMVSQFHVSKLFVGTDGYNEHTGFTNKDPLRAQAVSDMSTVCDKVIVLTESDKFKRVGTIPLRIEKPITLITDNNLDINTRISLENKMTVFIAK